MHVDRGGGIRRERRVLEGLGGIRALRRRAPARSTDGSRTRTGRRDVVAVDTRLDEVHRRRADEAGDEEVPGSYTLRGVSTCWIRPSSTPRRVSERHRLDLVVGDVNGVDAERAWSRDLEPASHPELGVEVGQRLVHEEEPRGAARSRGPWRRAGAGHRKLRGRGRAVVSRSSRAALLPPARISRLREAGH